MFLTFEISVCIKNSFAFVYHGFEDQLLWRYEDLKERYLELLNMDTIGFGESFFSADDYRYTPVQCFKTAINI